MLVKVIKFTLVAGNCIPTIRFILLLETWEMVLVNTDYSVLKMGFHQRTQVITPTLNVPVMKCSEHKYTYFPPGCQSLPSWLTLLSACTHFLHLSGCFFLLGKMQKESFLWVIMLWFVHPTAAQFLGILCAWRNVDCYCVWPLSRRWGARSLPLQVNTDAAFPSSVASLLHTALFRLSLLSIAVQSSSGHEIALMTAPTCGCKFLVDLLVSSNPGAEAPHLHRTLPHWKELASFLFVHKEKELDRSKITCINCRKQKRENKKRNDMTQY